MQKILEFFDSWWHLFVIFFLWRISAHLKAIRRHLAGKFLLDTIAEGFIKPKKKEDKS